MDFQIQRAPHRFTFQPEVPQTTKKGSRGGTATSLISESGALGGAAAGAALGSVVPVVGTAIGGILGAGLGAFGGRLAENKIRDNRLGVGDAAKEGALSAAFAGPLKALRYGSTATKALRGGSGLSEALAKSATRADAPGVVSSMVKRKAASKLNNVSDSLAQKSLKINDSQFATDFANRTGEEIGAFANRHNIVGKSAADIKRQVINPGKQLYNQGLEAIGTVSRSDVQSALKEATKKLSTSSFPEKRALAKDIQKRGLELISKYGNDIPAKELNKIKNEAYSNVDVKLVDSVGKTANNTYDILGNAFRKAINTSADRAGVSIDPKLLKDLGLKYKAKNMDELGNELFALQKLAQKADVKSRVGAGAQAIPLKAVIAGAGTSAINPVAGIATGALTAAANSPVAEKSLANLSKKAASKLSNSKTNTIVSGAKMGSKAALIESALNAQSSLPNISDTNAIIPTNNMPSTIPNSMVASPYSLSNGLSNDSNPFDINNIESNIAKLVEAGAKDEDIMQYMAIAEKMMTLRQKSEKSANSLNATQLQQANNAQSGLDSLNTIAQTLQSNPNAAKLSSLPGGSLTQSLTGTGSYAAAINNAADVIGRLRSGGAINQDEEKRFKALLPASFDSPETIQYKLSSLAELFQRFVNPQAASPSTQDPFVLYQ